MDRDCDTCKHAGEYMECAVKPHKIPDCDSYELCNVCGECKHYRPEPRFIEGYWKKHTFVPSRIEERTVDETDKGTCTASVPQWVWWIRSVGGLHHCREINKTTKVNGCSLFKQVRTLNKEIKVS